MTILLLLAQAACAQVIAPRISPLSGSSALVGAVGAFSPGVLLAPAGDLGPVPSLRLESALPAVPRFEAQAAALPVEVRYQKDFLPPDTTVSELMTPEGDVYLFRVIDQKYIPGYVGPFAREEGGVSYSLNPYIAVQWDSPYTRNPDSTLLIAKNNVHTGNLRYPGEGDYVGMRARGKLTPGTRLRDILSLNEVKVPIGTENVLMAVPLAEFQRIAAGFGRAFRIEELLERLRQAGYS